MNEKPMYTLMIPTPACGGAKLRVCRSFVEISPQVSVGERSPRTFERIASPSFDDEQSAKAMLDDGLRRKLCEVIEGLRDSVTEVVQGVAVSLSRETVPVKCLKLQISDLHIYLTEAKASEILEVLR